MKKKLQKIYLIYCNLFIVRNLWQASYQILLIIFLEEFIELNGNMDTMIKNVKLAKLHTQYETVFLNTQTLKMI